jgi:D-alanyl-D-alanine carboxypeptidase/D-alanyl-D-alanine-endopeptidase (penicillin-binding protein 4)
MGWAGKPTRLAAGAVVAAALIVAPAASARPSEPALELTAEQISRIEALMATPPLDLGTWGMQVVDVKTGRSLYSVNRSAPVPAASTTKNFTTAAALDVLGEDYRFRTPVMRSGSISRKGVLRGDLILRASGDLTMGGRALPGGGVDYTGFDHTDANEVVGPATLTPEDPLAGLNRLARQVKRAGIRRVGGEVAIDDRLWQQRLVGHEVISPMIVNDSAIDMTMTPTAPGETVSMVTRPATAAYSIEVQAQTVAADGPLDLEVHQADANRHVVVTGTIPAGTPPVVQIFRVPEPAYFGRTLFVEALERAGIDVDAAAVAPNDTSGIGSRAAVARLPRVAKLVSPPMSQFVKLISKVSHNLGSNTVPFWLGVNAGEPTLERGMRVIRVVARGAGIDPRRIELIDGQGGPGNMISPGAQARLLRYVAEQPYARAYLRALPIKGVDGIPGPDAATDPATGHVFQKNGLNGAEDANGNLEVQAMALAGYARAGGRELAFSVVVNHVPILGPDGLPSEDPADIFAAFTNFGAIEGITSLLYETQLGP